MLALASLLLLAVPAFASPAATSCSGCSTKNIAVQGVPANQTLIPHASFPVSFVAIGVGVQNYTCGATNTFASAGAVAELFDISCLYGKPEFNKVSDDAMKAWAKAPKSETITKVIQQLSYVRNPQILGEHYFITNPITGTGLSPKWDFEAHAFKGNTNAFVVGAKAGNIAAPTGSQDVDWLYLTNVQGSLANEIFRTDTRLGQPPASCTAGETASVKYVAKYYLTGGSVKKQ